MLEYVAGRSGAHLCMLVHHDDAAREFAYDADSKIGTFSTALKDEAESTGWNIISMKSDWNNVFKAHE